MSRNNNDDGGCFFVGPGLGCSTLLDGTKKRMLEREFSERLTQKLLVISFSV